MNIQLSQILKHKAVNGWGLLLLFSMPMSMFNYLAMSDTDMSSPEGVSHMIGVLCTMGYSFHLFSGSGFIGESSFPRHFFSVVDAQSKIYRSRICRGDGLASGIHFYTLDILSRLLFCGGLLLSR